MNVELGGGENPRRDGWVNVDIIEHEKVDKQCDFEKDKLPFRANTVDAIFCSHCLEHIKNVKHFLNECHRVTKKGGNVKFVVPYGLWEGAQKPVHFQCITECWFDFLRKDNSEEVYGFKVWDIVSMEIREDKEVKFEINCVLTPRK